MKADVVIWVGEKGLCEIPSRLVRGMVYRSDGRADRRCRAFRRARDWAEEELKAIHPDTVHPAGRGPVEVAKSRGVEG